MMGLLLVISIIDHAFLGLMVILGHLDQMQTRQRLKPKVGLDPDLVCSNGKAFWSICAENGYVVQAFTNMGINFQVLFFAWNMNI